MKKVMFNDKYGLTESVLKGTKTQTRRVVTEAYTGFGLPTNIEVENMIHFEYQGKSAYAKPRYIVDEVVAVAQRYSDMTLHGLSELAVKNGLGAVAYSKAIMGKGYSNKMFVRADLMPHHIRITNIRVEKLQDISDEDCMEEGVRTDGYQQRYYTVSRFKEHYYTPREAYAALIDKVSGKGTWDSNPWVFVYDFVLVD